MDNIIINDAITYDLRFPTSVNLDGSDARSTSPDYSCVYLILKTNKNIEGIALSFTLGKGNSVVKKAVDELIPIIINKSLHFIIQNMKMIYSELTNDTQMCWIGPEKGVTHLAASCILNSIWDLWCKFVNKPLWKLISEMQTSELIDLLNFEYILSELSPADSYNILDSNKNSRIERIDNLKKNGLVAYTTSVGWIGYSNDEIIEKCKIQLENGFKNFKMKVGNNLAQDIERAELIRKCIGWDNKLMMDANGVWNTECAIFNIKRLAQFRPYWIEEPTHPDDIIGHNEIQQKIYPIKVATGEQCPNKVMFKQFLKSYSISILQTDINRLASVNEWLVVAMLAHKFGIPMCMHAGGVGLCQMAVHLAAIDFICISNNTTDRITEYVEHLQEHFENPVKIRNGNYQLPETIGIGLKIKKESIEKYIYPEGYYWKNFLNIVSQ